MSMPVFPVNPENGLTELVGVAVTPARVTTAFALFVGRAARHRTSFADQSTPAVYGEQSKFAGEVCSPEAELAMTFSASTKLFACTEHVGQLVTSAYGLPELPEPVSVSTIGAVALCTM